MVTNRRQARGPFIETFVEGKLAAVIERMTGHRNGCFGGIVPRSRGIGCKWRRACTEEVAERSQVRRKSGPRHARLPAASHALRAPWGLIGRGACAVGQLSDPCSELPRTRGPGAVAM